MLPKQLRTDAPSTYAAESFTRGGSGVIAALIQALGQRRRVATFLDRHYVAFGRSEPQHQKRTEWPTRSTLSGDQRQSFGSWTVRQGG